MKGLYRGLALAVAVLVALQAAFIAYAVAGLGKWIEEGGTLDASAMQDPNAQVGGGVGFMLHGIGGTFLVPLAALLLLIISFFAKVPGGVKWALIVFGVTVVQYALAFLSRSAGIPVLGALHGLNALILFGVAVTAAMRVKRVARTEEPVPSAVA